MKYKYVRYEVYECPEKPTEYGKYVGSTPILEQAIKVAEYGNRFIKGVTANGEKIIFL